MASWPSRNCPTPDTIAGALQCCGYDEPLDLRSESDRLALAEMMFSYGAKSPMWGGEGNHFDRLRAEARREAEALFDDEHRNEALDTRVVNALGQTAREYAAGTEALWSTLRRIKDDPNATDEQKMVLRMYQKCDTTLGAGPVPEDIKEVAECPESTT